MPSFSSFLKRAKRSTERNNDSPPVATGGAASAVNDRNEKVQRRQSKRDFLRNLLSPSGPRSESRASRMRDDQVKPDAEVPPVEKQTTPMPNSNKPLPAPPQADAEEPAPPPNPSTKLNRIIRPLSIPEVHKLFSGAPQFFVRSEGHHTGPPKPSVAFPWNTEVQIRDLCDHAQNEDEAWGSVTAYPHITRDVHKNMEAIKQHKEKQRAHFMPVCHERPNMLSIQGLERGTIGFSAALEIGVADSLYEETEALASSGTISLAQRRNEFLNEKKLGLRPLAEPAVIAKLVEVTDSYHERSSPQDKSTVEWYTELFTQVLFPPTRVTDSNDPYSLHVQIEALLDVLAVPNIWIDFSLVEWRIRLGQILWGETYQSEAGNDAEINVEVHDSGIPDTQKFWLLLQILISCELLTRLDVVTRKAEHDPHAITAEEVRRFEEDAKPSVRWSLILARIWLENIRIEISLPASSPEEKKPSPGWLATLTGTIGTSAKESQAGKRSFTEFHSRHQIRQVSGLIHFARKLRWPQTESVAARFSQANALFTEGTSVTPAIGTPISMNTQRSSYFGNTTRPTMRRGLSKQLQQQRRSIFVQPSGWLSRSYLTGLILPGEGLTHFLISTLLENDAAAVSKLGEEANLYGGFLYSSRSYWSTACIVGRIVAAGKGASECMGWISSDVVPKGMEDAWVNVEVEMAPKNEGDVGPETARIWKKHVVEREGYVLGDGDVATSLPGDFTLPVDEVRDEQQLEVSLESLELFAAVESVHNTPVEEKPTPLSEASTTANAQPIRSYSALMTFNINSISGGSKAMTFDISYDVHFATAHPCVPSHHTSILDSPTSPSFVMPAPQPHFGTAKLSPHELYAGHPLHKSFIYKREVLSEILQLLPSPPTSTSQSTPPLASLHTSSQEVFVIDCNESNPPSQPAIPGNGDGNGHSPSTRSVARKRAWGSDLEMLARAWCAEKGYNALISRRGRNCIACSIREARALGWKIVLRFG